MPGSIIYFIEYLIARAVDAAIMIYKIDAD